MTRATGGQSKSSGLLGELHQVARRRMRLAFVPHRNQGPLELPNLQPILEELEPSLFKTSPPLAIVQVFKRALPELPDEPIELFDREPHRITWRELGLFLYNPTIDPNLDSSYDARYRELKVRLGIDPREDHSTLGRRIFSLREMLAAKLVEMAERKSSPIPEEEEPGFIKRPSLTEEFDKAVLGGSRILMYGEPGTGKTRLARYLVRKFLNLDPDDPISEISAHDEETLHRTLSTVLIAAGATPPSTDLHSLQAAFRSLMSSDKALPIVLLDNVEDKALLNALVPPNPAGRILVTSRKPLADSSNATLILVENMESAEAKDMVRLHAPEVDEEGALRLAEALHRRPLAIEHGCACFLDKPFDGNVDLFCEALERNIAAVLDSYGGEDDVTLVAIYRMVIEQLSRLPNALKLLDIVSCLGPIIDGDTVLPLLWPSSKGEQYEELLPEDTATLAKAVRTLEGRSLVRRDSSYLVMHSLTAELVKLLRLESAPQALASTLTDAIKCLSRLKIDSWSGGRPTPADWPFIAPILNRFINILPDDPEVGIGSKFVDEMFAIVLRQCRQAGKISPAQRERAVTFVKGSLVRGTLPGALHRETLELGYLQGVKYVDDKSILDALREIMPDAFAYEAAFSGAMRPLSADYDPLAIAAITKHTLPVCEEVGDWAHAGRLMYATGVMYAEQALWVNAESWLKSSLELCRLAANDHPEMRFVALECLRRLIEVGQYGGSEALNDYLIDGAKLMRECLTFAGRGGDSALFIRFSQTASRFSTEKALDPATSIEEARVIEQQQIEAQKLLIDTFSRLQLANPMLECFHELWRLKAARGEYDLALLGFKESVENNRHKQNFAGVALSELGALKVQLAMSKEDRTAIAESARSLASTLREQHRLPFWSADALTVAYAAELMAGTSGAELEEIRELTRQPLAAMNRMDKLDRAERVGSGEAPATILLKV